MQTIYDLNKGERLPPYQPFGQAVIANRIYLLAMARITPDALPSPLVICMDRGVAWHGSWEFLVDQAQKSIEKSFPAH